MYFPSLGGGNSDSFEGAGRASCQEKASGQQRTAPFAGGLAAGALGLGGSVTTLDQSGERLCDPDVPGARSGEEQAGATRAAKRGGG